MTTQQPARRCTESSRVFTIGAARDYPGVTPGSRFVCVACGRELLARAHPRASYNVMVPRHNRPQE